MEGLEYLNKVSNLIQKKYDGEPDGLDAFIEQIEMLEQVTPADHNATMIKLIRSRCIGAAKRALPTAADSTVAQIKNALKAKIMPDTTDVVLGRLLALKHDKTSLQTFQEKAEELSEKLEAAYISDGIPNDVAKKWVVKNTVEMCKATAKTPYVQTVMASTPFNNPKDVLAKFITEIASENKNKEATVLNVTSNRGRGGYGRGRGRGQNSNYRQYNNYNNGQYQNRRNYNNYNNNGQYRGNWRGNGRGRGRGRGGHQNYDNQQYVRIIQPGNEQNPAAEGNVLTLQQARQ